jgi:hypothetical protein
MTAWSYSTMLHCHATPVSGYKENNAWHTHMVTRQQQLPTPRSSDKVSTCTNQLTPWSRVIKELTFIQPLKKILTSYATKRFVTVFTRVLHWSLFWARSIQSIPLYAIPLRSILILTSHLRIFLPTDLLPPDRNTKILFAFLFSYGW